MMDKKELNENLKSEVLVSQSNSLINIKKDYKLTELKMIAKLISSVERDDDDFTTKHVRMSDLGILNNSNDAFTHHNYVNELCIDLMKKPFQIPGTKTFTNWFSSLTPDNGVIEYRFDPALKPFLLELKREYTTYYLSNVMKLEKTYSFKIYELLKQFENKGYRTFRVEDLRDLLLVPNSYNTSNFRKILETAKNDLGNHTDITFEYKLEKRNSRKFTHIIFSIAPNITQQNISQFKNEIKKLYKGQTVLIVKEQNGTSKNVDVLSNGRLIWFNEENNNKTSINEFEAKEIWNYLYTNRDKLDLYDLSLENKSDTPRNISDELFNPANLKDPVEVIHQLRMRNKHKEQVQDYPDNVFEKPTYDEFDNRI